METAGPSSSFKDLRAASQRASAAARGASRKTDTRCEMILRRELWRRGLRYRLHEPGLPGRPDIIFPRHRVALFCDGDFWHGRHLPALLAKLARGHNAPYWIAKVRRNVARDRRQTAALEASGWRVLRFWETDIVRRPSDLANLVVAALKYREPRVLNRRSRRRGT